MDDTTINAKFDRIGRMIAELREFAKDETFREDIDEGNIKPDEVLSAAINMLADDIHDCEDEYESGGNPHAMREAEFDLFLQLLEEMR